MSLRLAIICFFFLQFLGCCYSLPSPGPQCKTALSSEEWPSEVQWANLNRSISGHLIKTTPPGAVCHPGQASFNTTACISVQAGWKIASWHTNNPVSSLQNNWNNDTCLPDPTAPCSGDGYPIYVVNATSPEDVKEGIEFAGKHKIRLIVKGTGHDYLGRSSAPNSLSIWTHNLRGLVFHEGFQPKKCGISIDGHAITAGAGTQMLELDEQAHLRNLTIVSGGGGSVGVGGYLTGGGHAALSSTYGMAAEQVLEMEIVTPRGEIMTINECQNTDLFWAMRGGGGSTFGAITSVTIRAYPSTKFLASVVSISSTPGTQDIWTAAARLLSQFPNLNAQGISCYLFIDHNAVPPVALNITTNVDIIYGTFFTSAFSPQNTSSTLYAALEDMVSKSTSPFPQGQFQQVVQTPIVYDDFWGWYKFFNGPLNAGNDFLVGSRLFDEKALTGNVTKLAETLETVVEGSGNFRIFLVGRGGKSLRKVVPRGGDTPATGMWKNALAHGLYTMKFPPHDPVAKARVKDDVHNIYNKALRDLIPDMGAYINEANPYEPDYQTTYWGDNYARLARIKKEVDPDDVLWCSPCVGNEGWAEYGKGGLCRV
ncbi:hypothetical protein HYFRA_00001470 [Hymenoscyphus fraxineus]|uniref:FAD-binding PCMH-type domain-containing protein n=1 Tax=Hymenoscyphus fraxineus TaxID=746836 RepID=A0A9N9PMF3_9HELO|nr:hypothetical protein HYFRA_00001470 [Hymenoscyphus fraxineus]